MWPVIIITASSLINSGCVYDQLAVGQLPNGKIVLITRQIDYLFTIIAPIDTTCSLVKDEEGCLYIIRVEVLKSGEFILFITEVMQAPPIWKASGTQIVISSANLCQK